MLLFSSRPIDFREKKILPDGQVLERSLIFIVNDQSCLLQRISENVKIFTQMAAHLMRPKTQTNQRTETRTKKLRANTIESYLSKLTKPEETRKTCMQKKAKRAEPTEKTKKC